MKHQDKWLNDLLTTDPNTWTIRKRLQFEQAMQKDPALQEYHQLLSKAPEALNEEPLDLTVPDAIRANILQAAETAARPQPIKIRWPSFTRRSEQWSSPFWTYRTVAATIVAALLLVTLLTIPRPTDHERPTAIASEHEWQWPTDAGHLEFAELADGLIAQVDALLADWAPFSLPLIDNGDEEDLAKELLTLATST